MSAKKWVFTLVLDDQDFDRTRIRRFAQKSNLPLNIVEASSIDIMASEMQREEFDLFLVDYQLPEGNGLEAVDVIQQHASSKDATVIMITGQQDVEVAVSAFRQGCHDLITKEELSPALLQERMRTALSRVGSVAEHDLWEKEKFQRQLQQTLREMMQSEAMQHMLNEGLRHAMRSTHFANGPTDDRAVQTFLLDFVRSDDFQFE